MCPIGILTTRARTTTRPDCERMNRYRYLFARSCIHQQSQIRWAGDTLSNCTSGVTGQCMLQRIGAEVNTKIGEVPVISPSQLNFATGNGKVKDMGVVLKQRHWDHLHTQHVGDTFQMGQVTTPCERAKWRISRVNFPVPQPRSTITLPLELLPLSLPPFRRTSDSIARIASTG